MWTALLTGMLLIEVYKAAESLTFVKYYKIDMCDIDTAFGHAV